MQPKKGLVQKRPIKGRTGRSRRWYRHADGVRANLVALVDWRHRKRLVCVRVNVRCVWLRSCAAVLRVIVCLSSLCVGTGSRVCPVRG